MGAGILIGAKDDGFKQKTKEVSDWFDEFHKNIDKLKAITSPGQDALDGLTGSLTDMDAGLRKTGNEAGDAFTEALEPTNLFGEKIGWLINSAKSLWGSLKKLGQGVKSFFGSIKKEGGEAREKEVEVSKGFELIGVALGKLDELIRQSRLGNFISSVSLAALEKIKHGIEGISESGHGLTTSLEAMGTANRKTALSMGVNFGYAGAELAAFTSQASSMAIGLNIGASEAASAIYEMSLASEEFGAVNIKSAEELAKFTDATHLNASEFRTSLVTMRNQFGFTDKQLNQVVGSFTSFGQQAGDVGGTLNKLPAMMDRLKKSAAIMGGTIDKIKLAKFSSETAALAAGFLKLTGNTEEATESAFGIADALLEAKDHMKGAFAGTKEDIPKFVEELAIGKGDVVSAFEDMNKGPAGFVKGLTKMVQSAKKSGGDFGKKMDFFRQHLIEAVGEKSADTLVNFFAKADDATLAAMESTEKATADLGKLGKAGFTTGRTLQEEFDLMKQAALTHFVASSKAGKNFVEEFGKQARKFNEEADKISAKGGPLGMIVDKMRDVARVGGPAGLLPKSLMGMGVLFGRVLETTTPLITAMGSLGFRVGDLASPMGILGAATAGVGLRFADLRAQGKTTKEALDQIFTKDIPKLADKVWSTLKAVPWGKIFEGVKKVFHQVLSFFESVDWRGIFDKAMSAAASLWDKIVDFFKSVDWGKVFSTLGDATAGLINKVIGWLKSVPWEKVFMGLGAILGKVVNWFVDVLSKIDWKGLAKTFLSALKGLAVGIVALIATIDWKSLLMGLVGIIGDVFMAAGEWLGDMLEDLFPGFLEGLGEKIMHPLDTMVDYMMAVFKATGKALYYVFVWPVIKFFQLIGWTAGKVWDAIKAAGSAVAGVLTGVWNTFSEFMGDMWAGISEVASVIWAGIQSAIDAVVQFITRGFQAFGEFLDTLWAGIVAVVTGVWNGIQLLIEGPVEVIKSTWDTISTFFSGLWEGIKEVTSKALTWLEEKFTSAKDFLLKPFEALGELIDKLFGHSINTVVAEDMEKTKKVVEDATSEIADHLQTILFEAVHTALTDSFKKSFKIIAEQTDTFAEKEIKAFKAMAKVLDSIFFALAESVSASIQLMTFRIGNQATELNTMFVELTNNIKELDRQKDKYIRDEKFADTVKKVQAAQDLSETAQQSIMVTAGDWWTGPGGSGGYRDMFQDHLGKMDEMLGELKGIRTAVSGRAGGVGVGGDTRGADLQRQRDNDRGTLLKLVGGR